MSKYIVLWCLPACFLGLTVSATTRAQSPADETTRQEIQAIKEYLRTMQMTPASASVDVPGPQKGTPRFEKSTALKRPRKSYFMNGNRIKTEVYNYGGIAPGYDALRGVNNVVWRNLDYVFQFGPIVGASVPNPANPTTPIHIISDALWDYPALREVNPTADTLWQWQPLDGYDDPEQDKMASNPAPDADGDGKPDSWPRQWYNPTLGRYVWPGYLSQDVPSADLEVFWAMDDRDNMEFAYYPFANDSSRRGIGLQVEGRGFQWSNALAENTIFFVYTITNVSDRDLDTLFFGIYGDPDLGGGSPENTDDNGYFIPPYDTTGVVERIPVYSRSLVYFWDPDMVGARGLRLGYMACKFLESPGNPLNGIDDDGDKMIDERQDDGIDNDGDWNVFVDDVGVDGVPGTNDQGEGDGLPTRGVRLPDGSLDPLSPGEPNFELTDLDEADQIGLTSFNSWRWNDDKISNDESMWQRSVPRNFGSIQQNQDIVFIFGSGYISLKRQETKRISMALLFGESLDDLLTSAKTVQTIYNQNYRWFKPPVLPTLTAVPGDRKVTLYWDTKAEESVDPITGKDFEGYVLYRSTDPEFNEIQTVTDGKGAAFLSTPLTDLLGVECKWDIDEREEPYTDVNRNGKYDTGEPYVDLNHDNRWSGVIEDTWKGYHPVPYQDRGVQYYLGTNRGLVHMYVDSNNVINGQTYYYAVVAYDHGDSTGIPPTETTKKITLDPITSLLTFDPNTAQVIPGPRASGYVPPAIAPDHVTHVSGIGNGPITFTILNDLVVEEGTQYDIIFKDSLPYFGKNIYAKNYSILRLKPVTETFATFDTNFTQLDHTNISIDSVLTVKGTNGTVYTYGADYILNATRGSIRRTGNSAMPANGTFTITYRYYPVSESRSLSEEDNNPTFEGVKVQVVDHPQLEYDPSRSGWIEGKSNLVLTVRPATVGARRQISAADYEIVWSSQNIDSAVTQNLTKTPVPYTASDVTTGVPIRVVTFLNEPFPPTRNRQWDPGEEIVIFKTGNKGVATDTLTWGVILANPTDSTQKPVAPTDGDVLSVKTKRPFDQRDRFRLTTEAGQLSTELAASRMDQIYVVPNPYVGYNVIEPTTRLPGQTRGERRMYFENLPPKCTIRIFTLSGDLVAVLEHESTADNGREFWNLLNRDGFSVAYGVYIAHIDAPEVGETILKFAIIK
jgi:hypothetical protein